MDETDNSSDWYDSSGPVAPDSSAQPTSYSDFGDPIYGPTDTGDNVDAGGGYNPATDTNASTTTDTGDNVDAGGGYNPATGQAGGTPSGSNNGTTASNSGNGSWLSSVGKALGINTSSDSTDGLLNNLGPLLLAGGAGYLLSGLLGSKGSGSSTISPITMPASNLSPSQLAVPTTNPGSVMGTPVAPIQPANTGLGQLITPQQISPVSPTIGK